MSPCTVDRLFGTYLMLDSATRYSRKNRKSPRILIAATRATRDSAERYGTLWKTSRGSITTGICFFSVRNCGRHTHLHIFNKRERVPYRYRRLNGDNRSCDTELVKILDVLDDCYGTGPVSPCMADRLSHFDTYLIPDSATRYERENRSAATR